MYVYLCKLCAYSVLYWRVNVCVCFFSFLLIWLNYSDGEKGASSVYTEKASIYLYNVCNSLAWRLHHHLFLWKSNHSCFFLFFFVFFRFYFAPSIRPLEYIEHVLCVYVCGCCCKYACAFGYFPRRKKSIWSFNEILCVFGI